MPAPPCLCVGGGGVVGPGAVGLFRLRARGARPRAAGVSRRARASVACFPPCSMGGWVVGGMLSGSGAVRPGCGPARRAGPFFVRGVGLACVGGLVVICIVDASIFVLCVVIVVVFVWVVLCVCFFGRSVDALASGADEGRGGLRYSSGSRLAGCDPRVSEWGDPARVMSCHLHLNCIGCGG